MLTCSSSYEKERVILENGERRHLHKKPYVFSRSYYKHEWDMGISLVPILTIWPNEATRDSLEIPPLVDLSSGHIYFLSDPCDRAGSAGGC